MDPVEFYKLEADRVKRTVDENLAGFERLNTNLDNEQRKLKLLRDIVQNEKFESKLIETFVKDYVETITKSTGEYISLFSRSKKEVATLQKAIKLTGSGDEKDLKALYAIEKAVRTYYENMPFVPLLLNIQLDKLEALIKSTRGEKFIRSKEEEEYCVRELSITKI